VPPTAHAAIMLLTIELFVIQNTVMQWVRRLSQPQFPRKEQQVPTRDQAISQQTGQWDTIPLAAQLMQKMLKTVPTRDQAISQQTGQWDTRQLAIPLAAQLMRKMLKTVAHAANCQRLSAAINYKTAISPVMRGLLVSLQRRLNKCIRCGLSMEDGPPT